MATMTFVYAEDFEDGDLVDLTEVFDEAVFTLPVTEGQYLKVVGEPEDIDRFNVRLHTSHGSVVVERALLLPYRAAEED